MPAWTKPPDEWARFFKTSQPGFTRDTAPFFPVGPNSNTGQIPELARVIVDDDYAQPWTVVLNPVERGQRVGSPPLSLGALLTPGIGDNSPQIILDSFATIRFGRGGVFSEVIVDWPSSGLVLTVYGSYVQVRGGISALGAATVGPDARQFMTAHITPGRTQPTHPVGRTLNMFSVAAEGGISESIPVPRFARSVQLGFSNTIASLIGDVIVQGEFVAGGGTPRWQFTPSLIGTVASIMSPTFGLATIPGGTNFVKVVNNTDALLSLPFFYFELGI